MALHSPYSILNPFRNGFSINPCSNYYIFPSKVRISFYRCHLNERTNLLVVIYLLVLLRRSITLFLYVFECICATQYLITIFSIVANGPHKKTSDFLQSIRPSGYTIQFRTSDRMLIISYPIFEH